MRNTPIEDVGAAKIVQSLSEGLPVKLIAHKNGLNVRSTETTILRIKKKYECSSVGHLVAVFINMGLIDGPEVKSAATFR